MPKLQMDVFSLLSFADKIGTDGCREALTEAQESAARMDARYTVARNAELAILDPENFGPDAKGKQTPATAGPTNQDPAGQDTSKKGNTCPTCGKGKRRGQLLCAACAKANAA